MNKKISLLICFLISLFFLSCNDPFKKTNVYIFDSENGHIEVSLLSEANQKITFEITAYPDEGYELLKENIRITNYSFEFYGIPVFSHPDKKFTFTVDNTYDITISTIFTMIQE